MEPAAVWYRRAGMIRFCEFEDFFIVWRERRNQEWTTDWTLILNIFHINVQYSHFKLLSKHISLHFWPDFCLFVNLKCRVKQKQWSSSLHLFHFATLNGHCDSRKCQKLETSDWHLAAATDLHKLFFYFIVSKKSYKLSWNTTSQLLLILFIIIYKLA